MGETPLDSQLGIAQIKGYLRGQNVTTLWDISEWSEDEPQTWKTWCLPIFPHLQDERQALLFYLQGKLPISKKNKDARGWGNKTRVYTTA